LSRALGHPARIAVLRRLLAAGECVCGEIVDLLPLAQATVSQHLKVLREAGWVEGETRGTRICYGAVPGTRERYEKLWSKLIARTGGSR
jgi:ArsR family transcriptional regulator